MKTGRKEGKTNERKKERRAIYIHSDRQRKEFGRKTMREGMEKKKKTSVRRLKLSG